MSEYSVNLLLMSISTDNNYNDEVRKLASELLKSKCSIEAKIAIIEACIESRN